MDKYEYFATRSAKEVAENLEGKLSEWNNFVTSNGIVDKMLKSYRTYYGRHFATNPNFTDSEIVRTGEEGELAAFSVNHYRNLIKHILNLTTSQKPAFDARAINSDTRSLVQARLANNVLDYYLREKRLNRYLRTAAEQSLVLAKGFLKVTWEPSLGEPMRVENYTDENGQIKERMKFEGDIKVTCPSPLDVFVDQSQEDWNTCEWIVTREYQNKYNLAVRHPELKHDIERLQTKMEIEGMRHLAFHALNESNDVPVFEFYHKRTEAVPNGRLVIFCNKDVVLYDGPIPYKRLPVFRIVPGEIYGTTEGYTDAYDLLALQEVFNVCVSTAFSNIQAFGVQNVLIPEGCNLSVDQLSQSLAGIKYDPQAGKPEALQLTQSPAELYQFIPMIEKMMETISGINSVARGDPDHSLKSGIALSIVQSMATQYASGFSQSYADLLEDVGTFILDLLKDFAETKRIVSISGKFNRAYVKEFSGKDLSNISRVAVDMGNPIARTTAGRIEIAQTLMQNGMLKTPQEFFTVLNTGTLDTITEGPQAELDLIHRENEMMMDGAAVTAIVGEAHVLHMQEHRSLLSNPAVKMNGQITQGVLEHIQQHMQIYKTQDPLWSMVSGEPPAPPPPPPPPGGMPPGPGGPPPSSGPEGPSGPGMGPVSSMMTAPAPGAPPMSSGGSHPGAPSS